jgi:hypothetical protein
MFAAVYPEDFNLLLHEIDEQSIYYGISETSFTPVNYLLVAPFSGAEFISQR